MKTLDVVAASLLIIGGVNWGLVGLARFDLVALLTGAGGFGQMNALGAVIYGLVGLAAAYHAVRLPAMAGTDARRHEAVRRAA